MADQVCRRSEHAQIDQRVRQHLHPIVPLLDTFKAKQQPLELIFPGTGPFDTPPHGLDGVIEAPLASALGGVAMARSLFDGRTQPCIEDALPIACGSTATIEVELGAFEVQPDLLGSAFPGFQTIREQPPVRLMHGSHRDGS